MDLEQNMNDTTYLSCNERDLLNRQHATAVQNSGQTNNYWIFLNASHLMKPSDICYNLVLSVSYSMNKLPRIEYDDLCVLCVTFVGKMVGMFCVLNFSTSLFHYLLPIWFCLFLYILIFGYITNAKLPYE